MTRPYPCNLDPDDAAQLRKEEAMDAEAKRYGSAIQAEATRIVDAARDVDPSLAEAIDICREAGHTDLRIFEIMRAGVQLHELMRVS